MNNKILQIYLVPIIGLLLLSSCNKWMDLEPNDGIVKENYWKTKEQLYSSVIGAYASLLDDPLATNLFLWGELRADMVVAGLGATTDQQNILNGDILATNSITSWAKVYTTINNCNVILDNANKVLDNDPTLTQLALDNYISEIRGLRALMYFYLARSFGDVPLKLRATSTDEDIASVPKSTQSTIFAFIASELKSVETSVPTDFGDNASNKGRLTQYAIDATLTDVFLWEEKYDSAIIYANKVIYSGKYSLVNGDATWFNTLYYIGNSSESIFEFQFDAQKLNGFYSLFTTSRRALQAGETVMDDVFGIDYDNVDSVDIRGMDAAIRSSDNAIWKYTGVNASVSRASSGFYAHWIVYRYADVLLMKAEACAQVGQGTETLKIIRQIRNRAHALVTTEESPSDADKDGLSDYVLNERKREFAYEGKRWYDILRNAKRNNYAKLELLIDLASRTAPANKQQSLINKYKDYNFHYFPINSAELLVDKNLEQNNFYK
ncbi:RagB/SusD family nutrient uptake outer membrane protein [Rhizosphaericola mali]|uniref:RagB/SusD family nutrient uptake outer membrane protein n=1 Tax=Rhizosphaericola mali TaxID=2545455 RepID=A0A5P2G5B3_9BACT|nr:RagB/SusD family nutrient uptake outer membrane protein [Rhizosphaericola mali]QES88293.1 RagB/SusD family nutrient uptake outer membrane protein [Rhizosphaericola mali]